MKIEEYIKLGIHPCGNTLPKDVNLGNNLKELMNAE